MQVSRYNAPFSQQSWISAMLETSTERLSRKSPRPTTGSSTFLKFSRVSGCLTKRTPYSAATFSPRLVGRDDGDLVGLDADVAQDQRQDALADAAEADEDQATGERDVDRVLAHDGSGSCREGNVGRPGSLPGIAGGSRRRGPAQRGALSRAARLRASAADRCGRSPAGPRRGGSSGRSPGKSSPSAGSANAGRRPRACPWRAAAT